LNQIRHAIAIDLHKYSIRYYGRSQGQFTLAIRRLGLPAKCTLFRAFIPLADGGHLFNSHLKCNSDGIAVMQLHLIQSDCHVPPTWPTVVPVLWTKTPVFQVAVINVGGCVVCGHVGSRLPNYPSIQLATGWFPLSSIPLSWPTRQVGQ